ncbi:acetyl-CoA carboxylase carboxyltransferase subunit beta [Dolosicoccus paucivorans]|uniref:acetyl-CoA carboxylase carboxyltransferase subunit beta n=1 Tax=Dolosicoccus paucivorans TaxID=84521 RepID=UPI00088CB650|nr:acetyl-CoA carboxylase carboxyltransferase subunit beta [Dolosicoccus paucivorans]SDI33928.1 acetyl-CoA carboxylase carboxyl transferase subunit beta [Dolosicoccus paucivorans]
MFRRHNKIRLNPVHPKEYYERLKKVPDDLIKRCPHCQKALVNKQLPKDYTCYHCGLPLTFPAKERIEWLLDEGTFQEWNESLTTQNPLDFPGYQQKIDETASRLEINEAVITGVGKLANQPLAIGVMDSRFIMASMGTIVGEKLTRLFEEATCQRLPVVLFLASGGARMQEGILSLMQMAKVSQAVERHDKAGLFYLCVLTNPTTGGVTASFATQADIILAEPRALVGFAGRRVIEQTTKVTLPEDFQQAETVLANGFIDHIVPRSHQHETLSFLLKAHSIS